MSLIIRLDYSLTTPEERNKLVTEIIADLDAHDQTPSPQYLESLADYLLLCLEKQERHDEKEKKKLLTSNRMVTINKRETSFEGLVSQFDNGESGIHSIITENKNVIFQPKVTITKADLEEIEPLRQLHDSIEYWE